MATKYSAIITAIDTLIATITAVKEHYTYEPQQFTKYPAVTITPIGHQEEYLSLGVTSRTYTFAIRVYGQLDNSRTGTTNNSQITVRDLVDSIIDTIGLQSNITIGGSCDYSELTGATFKTIQKESSLFVGEIVLKVKKSYVRV